MPYGCMHLLSGRHCGHWNEHVRCRDNDKMVSKTPFASHQINPTATGKNSIIMTSITSLHLSCKDKPKDAQRREHSRATPALGTHSGATHSEPHAHHLETLATTSSPAHSRYEGNGECRSQDGTENDGRVDMAFSGRHSMVTRAEADGCLNSLRPNAPSSTSTSPCS